ncbi:3-hydroxy-3-methylglutaryl-coenzyme A (HMG-CoA) reductase isozyme, partial [Coemansia sp. RSA 2618]
PVRQAAQPEGGDRRAARVCAVHDVHGRRDGHEHDLKGLRAGAAVHPGKVPRVRGHLGVGQLLHGQEAGRDQLDRRPRQVCGLRGCDPGRRRAQGAQDNGRRPVPAQHQQEPCRLGDGRLRGRLQRTCGEHADSHLPGDGPGPGAERRVVHVHNADGAGQRRARSAHLVLDAEHRGGHDWRRHGAAAAGRLSGDARVQGPQPRAAGRACAAPGPRHLRRRDGGRAVAVRCAGVWRSRQIPHCTQPRRACHTGQYAAIQCHSPAIYCGYAFPVKV